MKNIILSIFSLLSMISYGQEIDFNVSVTYAQLQTVDPKVFKTMEKSIRDFLNNQVWTRQDFSSTEKIKASLQLNITKEISATSFEAELTIQSSRPVYGTNYETVVFRHKDKKFSFRYEEYQPIEYSENSYIDNLSHTLSYYAYIILGNDFDTFSYLGGEEYFIRAQDIVNLYPQGGGDKGWANDDKKQSNRYSLVNDYLKADAKLFRQSVYNYHRLGLDIMNKFPDRGRSVILTSLKELKEVDRTMPNTIIIRTFFNAKEDELIEIFKGGTQEEKTELFNLMKKLTPTKANTYRKL